VASGGIVRVRGVFAEKLRLAGYEVLNDLVFNQVPFAFGDADKTVRVIG